MLILIFAQDMNKIEQMREWVFNTIGNEFSYTLTVRTVKEFEEALNQQWDVVVTEDIYRDKWKLPCEVIYL